MSVIKDTGFSGRFFRPVREIRSFTQFGFVLPNYRPRGGDTVRRLPTPRATIYFAADVQSLGAQGRALTGIFCEGPHAKSFTVSHECGQMVAVKVRAGALRALLGVPARELRDVTISLEDIWGQRARDIAERVAGAPTNEARVAVLQQELRRQCRDHENGDPVAVGISGMIERSRGRIRVAELIARSGYSQRALLQKFDDWVGLTPKQYARLARLRATIVRLGAAPIDPAELALECGFYDQTHMIHEFQDLIGLPPRKFVQQSRAFAPVGSPASGRRALPGREQELYRLVGLVSEWVDLERGR